MTFHGIVQNGQIIIHGDEPLPEGVEVTIEVAPSRASGEGTTAPTAQNGAKEPTSHSPRIPESLVGCFDDLPTDSAARHTSLSQSLAPIVGAIKDLPADFSQRHDYYIHGTPDE